MPAVCVSSTSRLSLTSFMNRIFCILLVFASPFVRGANCKGADEQLVCKDGFLEIVSSEPVDENLCSRVAKKAIAAWNFDLRQMNWDPAIDMNRPLTLRLQSAERLGVKGVLGFAKAPGDLFVVSTAVLENPLGNGTLAHELGHIQAFRALGPDSKRSLRVPHYFLEAHGLSMGRAFRDSLGSCGNDYDIRGAKIVSKLSAGEANLILTTNVDYYRGDKHKSRVMEAFAVFFIDYLRVRKGIPDAVQRMGRVFESVGRGDAYEVAFEQTYRVPLDKAISQITEFMAQTEKSPLLRLKGTHYDHLLLSNHNL